MGRGAGAPRPNNEDKQDQKCYFFVEFSKHKLVQMMILYPKTPQDNLKPKAVCVNIGNNHYFVLNFRIKELLYL